LKAFHADTGIAEKWREYVKERWPGEGSEEDWEDAYLPNDKDERTKIPYTSLSLSTRLSSHYETCGSTA
jgi:hypothetical protein